MFERRDVLKFALGGLASASSAGAAEVLGAPRVMAQATPQAPAVDPAPFSHAVVTDLARAVSRQAFKAPTAPLPDPFASLTYDQYVAIKNRPDSAVWSADKIGFAIEPLHRGFIFTAPMQINLVENGVARALNYSASAFDFGKLTVPPDLKDLGFSGIRVLQTREGAPPTEVSIFQSASFFRALARGQNFGTMARGLTVRTADPKGEEFPTFRAMWIERPTLAANALVLHALLDSESITGAYRFTLRPGEATIIDSEITLFPRVAVDNVGIAGMQGTVLFGGLDRKRNDDIRTAVCDFSGLQMVTGTGEWLWRPVSNRDTLQISAFVDHNPGGFGFLQKDRDFATFQDDDQHWESRPSLWIEPIGEWGDGNVTLVEIPSEAEVNQNVIAFWRPKAALVAGSENHFAYRQFWCWSPPDKPALAAVMSGRSGRVPGAANANGRRRRFAVDFAGDPLGSLDRPDIVPSLTVSPGAIANVRLFATRARKTCRVVFDLDPGSETACEMRLVLQNQNKPVSETWLYRWTS